MGLDIVAVLLIGTMQIFLRLLDGRTRVLHLQPSDTVDALQHMVSELEGVPREEQRLMCGARQLPAGAPLAACGVRDECNVALLLRLRGGGGGSRTVQLTVQPRVQKEKWSLYWKESMSTKTLSLAPVQLTVDASTTIAEVQQLVAKHCRWDPVEKLERLEGFAETWERVLYRGRELAADKTLAAAGLPDTVTVTAVRKVLVPEGWKVVKEGDEESLSSTDTEDDF